MNNNEFLKLLRRDMKTYEKTITDITPQEKNDLREWVNGGHSVYENPYFLYTEAGHPMDFVEAERIVNDMRENPQDYYGIGRSDDNTDPCDTDLEPPF